MLLVPTLFGVTLLVFLLLRVAVAGDAVDVIAGDVALSETERAALLAKYGLDAPMWRQYMTWAGGLLYGNLGESFFTHRPVTQELASRLPVTLEIGGLALLLAWIIGVPVGVLSALRQDSVSDYASRGVTIVLLAVPSFWLALLVLVYGIRWFNWVPPIGWVGPFEDFGDHIQLVVPSAIVLGISLMASIVRFTRAEMLEILRRDYIRTARAKGLRPRVVVVRHALRNGLIPLVTLIGGEIPIIIGGTVIIESIFNIPGVGRYYIDSFNLRDYPVAQGINIVLATIVVGMNLLVDLSYGILDPRIRYT